MANRKQRRRRQKEQRHEYEVVYLDDEGNEIEVDPEEVAPKRGAGRREPAGDRGGRGGRAGRPIEPPSWRKSARRALIVAPLFVAFLLVIQQNLASAIIVALLYSIVFIPFQYGVDTFVYRQQLKRVARKG